MEIHIFRLWRKVSLELAHQFYVLYCIRCIFILISCVPAMHGIYLQCVHMCKISRQIPSFYYIDMISNPIILSNQTEAWNLHNDVIKWKPFPGCWSFLRGIHRSPMTSPRKGQWRGALMFSLICAWMNGWVNNGKAGDSRRHNAPYNTVMCIVKKDFILQLDAMLQDHFISSYIFISPL